MVEQFKAYFKEHHLLQPSWHFIAAVSGGIDSVVLCALCHQSGMRFSIAHCNFGLRGAESERDEAFVRALGAQYGVTVFVKHFATEQYAEEHHQSVQEAARTLRYSWFQQVREDTGAAAILLAHHANDNIETLLMNFFRGTGLQGLTGMPPESGLISHCHRPMLHLTRKEIEAFATKHQLQWVDDSSNLSLKYTRNYFRNELIPSLQKVFPQVEQNLLDNINRFQKVNAFYSSAVQEVKKKLVVEQKGEYHIPVKKLLQYTDTSIMYELLKDFHFSEKQVPELIKLAQSESGRFMENEHYRLIKHRNWFIITPQAAPVAATYVITEGEKKVALPNAVLELEQRELKKFSLSKEANLAQLDAKKIQFPLLVRRWKQGDYFYPLGLNKKKKLSRFFIDQKLSATEKEAVWVIESANRICWVVGHRIDDRFKITPQTKSVLQLTLSSL